MNQRKNDNTSNVTVLQPITKHYAATNLENLIKHNEITQDKLAHMVGVAKSTISEYVNEKRSPSIEFMVALKNLYNISITDFLTKELKSEDYQELKPSQADIREYELYQKYCGSYYMYYFDTSNYKGRDKNDNSAALRYGIINIYENPGINYRSTYSCISVMGLDDIKIADEIKDYISTAESNDQIKKYITENFASKMYLGDFELGDKHIYISLKHDNRDKVLAIFYKIEGNKPRFNGGMGTANSVSKGRESMPTIQFVGISRDKVILSPEEIHHTLLLNYPTFRAADEANELIALFHKLYMEPEKGSGREVTELSDLQKSITVKANLERYIKLSLEKNMFRYGKISNRDDDEWYHLLKDYTQKTTDDTSNE